MSIHVPLTDATRGLIGRAELAAMGPHAVLVNTSRGPVVDEEALADALTDGTIFAAGIDVFEREPEVHPKLLAAPRAVLLPHIGSASVATRTRMAQVACEGVVAVLAGGTPREPRHRPEPPRPAAAPRRGEPTRRICARSGAFCEPIRS